MQCFIIDELSACVCACCTAYKVSATNDWKCQAFSVHFSCMFAKAERTIPVIKSFTRFSSTFRFALFNTKSNYTAVRLLRLACSLCRDVHFLKTPLLSFKSSYVISLCIAHAVPMFMMTFLHLKCIMHTLSRCENSVTIFSRESERNVSSTKRSAHAQTLGQHAKMHSHRVMNIVAKTVLVFYRNSVRVSQWNAGKITTMTTKGTQKKKQSN